MANRLNEIMLREMSGKLQELSHGIFVDFTGISAEEANELRGRLLKNALRLYVIKNRIAKLAFQPILDEKINDVLQGPVAMIYGNDDPVAAAKEVVGCVSDWERLELKGGFLEGRTLIAADVKQLAKMPSKKELFSHIVGAITTPASNIVGGIEGLLREFNFGALATELSGLFTAYHAKKKDEGE